MLSKAEQLKGKQFTAVVWLDFGEAKELVCSVMANRTAEGLCLPSGRIKGIGRIIV